jgi:hypothetical protein
MRKAMVLIVLATAACEPTGDAQVDCAASQVTGAAAGGLIGDAAGGTAATAAGAAVGAIVGTNLSDDC